jgi:hypothetical protein
VDGRAEDRDGSAERLDPVFQADDARAAAGVGAPDAVVADREGEAAVAAVDPDVDDRGPRVLGGLGECLGSDVVGGRLEVLPGSGAQVQLELDRDGGATGPRLEGWAESGLGQDGRVDAAGDFPQLIQSGTETVGQERQLPLDVARGPGCHRRDGAGFQRERDDALLNTVVQVTLEPPPGLVRRGDDAGPGRGELGPGSPGGLP